MNRTRPGVDVALAIGLTITSPNTGRPPACLLGLGLVEGAFRRLLAAPSRRAGSENRSLASERRLT